jgi:hypothetical protein
MLVDKLKLPISSLSSFSNVTSSFVDPNNVVNNLPLNTPSLILKKVTGPYKQKAKL